MSELKLSKEQRQILDVELMYPDSGVCNIGAVFVVKNGISPKLAARAAYMAIDDIMTYKIRINRDFQPYLTNEHIRVVEWEGENMPSLDEQREWISSPFEFYDSPLCELRYRGDTSESRIWFKCHHMIMDGYGAALTLKRFHRYILKMTEGDEGRLEPDTYLVDLMKECSSNTNEDMAWLDTYVPAGMPDVWAIKKTKNGDIRSKRKHFYIRGERYDRIKRYVRDKHISFEAFLYAVLGIYESRITGAQRVCMGRSMLNRRKREMVSAGMKVNQMPVFIVVPDESFDDYCQYVYSVLFDMMRHSSASFSEYLRSRDAVNSYYDTSISYRSNRLILNTDDIELHEIENNTQELPLRLDIVEHIDGMSFDVQYQTANYHDAEIDAFVERIFYIMDQGLEGTEVKNISAVAQTDRTVMDRLNAEKDTVIRTEHILSQIERYADDFNTTAVSFGVQQLSYGYMWELSERIACWLAAQGIREGSIVAMQLQVDQYLPCFMLGVWRAGAAFLPVSIRESASRVEEIEASADILVTRKELEYAMKYTGVLELPAPGLDMTAYCMYTSGSTGMPKLVMISHRSLAWRVDWMIYQYGRPGTVLQKTAYTFDVSMWEFFLPLISGGRLCLLADAERANPRSIAAALVDNDVEVVHFVPSVLGLFLSYVEMHRLEFPSLRHVFVSGEALHVSMMKRYYKLMEAPLHNLYGPTECTIDVTFYDCGGQEQSVPIGRPLPGCDIDIVDKYGRSLPIGIEGELIVGGILVGEGYRGQTSGGYYNDAATGEKRYCTGDRCCVGFDGEIYYCGRSDRQCKINGIRIDLSQIEEAMLGLPDIQNAAVLVRDNQLVGVYTAAGPVQNIADRISRLLPVYSVPDKYVYIKEFPLNGSGKTDYRCLSGLASEAAAPKTAVSVENAEEAKLLAAIQERTGVSVSVDENIFRAGLDSLKLMDVILSLEKDGEMYQPEEFYENKNVRNIVRNRQKKVQWLHRSGNKVLVVAFPYAAGNAEAFVPIADELAGDADFCVTHSTDIADVVRSYEKCCVLGYCTGTVLALEACEKMAEKEIWPAGLVLCAALPPGAGVRCMGTPGERLGTAGVRRFIRYLHRHSVDVTDSMVELFRRDSSHFSDFFKTKHVVKCDRILLCFGREDILTVNSKHRWKNWKKYLRGHIRVCVYSRQHHFFLTEKKKEMAGEIRRMLS